MNTLLGLTVLSCLSLVVRAKVVPVDQEERSECGDGLGDGWFGTGPNCYNLMRYYEYFQSRLECQEMCIWSLEGKLASIHSIDEQDFIMGLIQDSGVLGHPTWTGGVLNGMGEWSWDDNSPWDYENWAAGNGTESNGGGCMFLDDQGAWRAEDCAKKTADWNCICQKSL